jgi:hypothetical protein
MTITPLFYLMTMSTSVEMFGFAGIYEHCTENKTIAPALTGVLSTLAEGEGWGARLYIL